MSNIVYIASPYTSDDPAVRESRYHAAMHFLDWMLKRDGGELLSVPYAPIVAMHEYTKRFSAPHDAAFWRRYNEAFLLVARSIYVLKLPGWESSVGIGHELDFAAANAIPIAYAERTGNGTHYLITYKA